MAQDKIDEILAANRKAAAPEPAESGGDKFFSILGGEGLHENFIELQLSNGNRTCFSYDDLNWFNYDPQAGCIDMDFGCALVTIKGRGLASKLWNGIKSKRVAWIKEKDSEMQDHTANETFIESILIAPTEMPDDGEETEKEK
jgi:hypothetical protein